MCVPVRQYKLCSHVSQPLEYNGNIPCESYGQVVSCARLTIIGADPNPLCPHCTSSEIDLLDKETASLIQRHATRIALYERAAANGFNTPVLSQWIHTLQTINEGLFSATRTFMNDLTINLGTDVQQVRFGQSLAPLQPEKNPPSARESVSVNPSSSVGKVESFDKVTSFLESLCDVKQHSLKEKNPFGLPSKLFRLDDEMELDEDELVNARAQEGLARLPIVEEKFDKLIETLANSKPGKAKNGKSNDGNWKPQPKGRRQWQNQNQSQNKFHGQNRHRGQNKYQGQNQYHAQAQNQQGNNGWGGNGNQRNRKRQRR